MSASKCELVRSVQGESSEEALGFAAVYEDPAFEIAAFGDVGGGVYVGPTSGGDTALGLLASGAERVISADVNRSQNHHVELLHAARTRLSHVNGLALLDIVQVSRQERQRLFGLVSDALTPESALWWSARPKAIDHGVLRSGKTERGMAVAASIITALMAGRRSLEALLAARDAAEQRRVFDEQVRTRRWRAGLAMALNPTTCRPLYREFFDNIDAEKFSASMRGGIETAFRDIPIWDNHYLHLLFERRYRQSALPIYLTGSPSSWGQLDLIDGDLTTVLRSQEPQSIDGVWLSNVGEWLPGAAFEQLLNAAARAVRPGGRVIWSNFVPRTRPLPAALEGTLTQVSNPQVLDRSLIRYQRVVAEVS